MTETLNKPDLRLRRRLRLSGVLEFETGWRIGSGSEGETMSDLGIVLDPSGMPLLPGSSLKGKLRNTCEALAHALDLRACLLNFQASGVRCSSDVRLYSQELRNELKEVLEDGLAGQLEWIEKNTCDVCKLFGSPVRASRLRLSDGQLLNHEAVVVQVRDGVVLDRDSHTAVNGSSTTTRSRRRGRASSSGSTWRTRPTTTWPWSGRPCSSGSTAAAWAASPAGAWAGSACSMARRNWTRSTSTTRPSAVSSSPTPTRRTAGRKSATGRSTSRKQSTRPSRRGKTMLRQWHCQADVTLRLHPIDPILIKSGYATLDGPDMVPVRTFRDGQQTYYFPGSSLKGTLRSHFERVCRTLCEGSVCIPYYDGRRVEAPPVPAERGSVGCGFREPDAGRPDTSSTAYLESCPACRLFGSLRFAGRFSIADALPVKEKMPTANQVVTRNPSALPRNGVGINRFTGGTVSGVLYDLIVLEGGEYQTQVRLQNFELWQLAAVYFLLCDLRDGLIALGSGRSRGLGRVRGEVKEFTLTYLKPQPKLCGLEHLASPDDRIAYDLDSGPLPEVALGQSTIAGLRYRYGLADWVTQLEPIGARLDAFLATHGPRGKIPENHR